MTDRTTEGPGGARPATPSPGTASSDTPRPEAGNGFGSGTGSAEGGGGAGSESVRREAEAGLREVGSLLGDTLRVRIAGFVEAVGEALRAGGDTLEKRKYAATADCFVAAAERVEDVWTEIEHSARDGAAGGAQPIRQRLNSNPTLAFGAALAAGFLVGAFLRSGLDEPDRMP